MCGELSDKEQIRALILESGASAVGFAKAEEVDAAVMRGYDEWIAEGKSAGMDYLRRHAVLKRHPRSVLENASTVISIAFSYAPARFRDASLPAIACYAYGDDYHDVIRRRLVPTVEKLKLRFSGDWRICIDSAPIEERYWALKSGIGVKGINGSVIVENCGGYVFLAEIVTTLRVDADRESNGKCENCGACVRACPQKALSGDGTVDSRRCLSYLTIEHKGDWEGDCREAMNTDAARHTLYGCDICLRVCPHNLSAEPTGIEEFTPRERIMSLTAAEAASLTQEQFSTLFRGSPIKRAKLAGLRRNAANILAGIAERQNSPFTWKPDFSAGRVFQSEASLP